MSVALPVALYEPTSDASSDLPCLSSASLETETSSTVDSTSSTPPTSISDACSQSSEAAKLENITVALGIPPQAPELESTQGDGSPQPQPQLDPNDATTATSTTETPAATPPGRPRRAARAISTYNLSQLSGTATHGKRRANGDIVAEKRRRVTVSGATLPPALDSAWSLDQLDTPPSARRAVARREPAASARPATRRTSTRGARDGIAVAASKISALTKRGKKALDKAVSSLPRELRRLQDTDEFAHIDTKPVYHTVWSNGKFVPAGSAAKSEPARKKTKLAGKDAAAAAVEEKEEEDKENDIADVDAITPSAKKRRVKKYLEKGLYAGQPLPNTYTVGLTLAEKKKMARIPGLETLPKPNKVLPLPIYNGLRLLIKGRDFKLPFDVCNPLPPGQPKPDEWRKMTKNRFIGDSKEYWRKTPHFNDFQSKCVCTPEDGCAESCQNRIMLYECDSTNCNAGKEYCTNRAFGSLAERRAGGNKYGIGVEVIKTADRGYGVRSNRCFEPNQIITEYTGEIITEEECDRRMREKYKDNACYYLMSFDQNMIIDATTGSIARFVNHSCNPNCRMVKWIVGGNPRMALFAGDRPIMTGEELTYDYKFDPFSAKNVQTCLCGSDNCRGVLGPKPKPDPAEGKGKGKGKDIGAVVKAGVTAGKRKLKELLGEDKGSAKKRKVDSGAKVVVRKSIEGNGMGNSKGKGAKVAPGSGVKGKGKLSPAKAAQKGGAATAKAATKAATKTSTLKKTLAGRVIKKYATKKQPAAVQTKATTSKGSTSKVSVSAKGSGKGPRKVTKAASPKKSQATPPKKAPATPTKASRASLESQEGSSIVAKVDDKAPGFRTSPVSKSGRVRKLTEKALGVEG
ncbi:related to histone-lysine N-methyltransferase [Cephalotrichum gorgonifer]|uniref:Related to histone-lysine N-methyltransferase n=1 Tax=Cephalotrichum gorgonifer TaxID=2041049 RepID=A0AAE8SWG9_9PEZI|nr:related to histone-lysine N-methyltransferase [Cephalotrichum gorgonifer]